MIMDEVPEPVRVTLTRIEGKLDTTRAEFAAAASEVKRVAEDALHQGKSTMQSLRMLDERMSAQRELDRRDWESRLLRVDQGCEERGNRIGERIDDVLRQHASQIGRLLDSRAKMIGAIAIISVLLPVLSSVLTAWVGYLLH